MSEDLRSDVASPLPAVLVLLFIIVAGLAGAVWVESAIARDRTRHVVEPISNYPRKESDHVRPSQVHSHVDHRKEIQRVELVEVAAVFDAIRPFDSRRSTFHKGHAERRDRDDRGQPHGARAVRSRSCVLRRLHAGAADGRTEHGRAELNQSRVGPTTRQGCLAARPLPTMRCSGYCLGNGENRLASIGISVLQAQMVERPIPNRLVQGSTPWQYAGAIAQNPGESREPGAPEASELGSPEHRLCKPPDAGRARSLRLVAPKVRS